MSDLKVSGEKKELLDIAMRACKVAGAEIMKIYASGEFDVQTKNDNSPLTKADLASNEALFFYLNNTRIDICSEERILSAHKRASTSRFWLIDPLDGTKDN